MAGLDSLAKSIRAGLGRAAFLRRDQKGRALFVSDLPRHVEGELPLNTLQLFQAQNLVHGCRDGLLLLDLSFLGYQLFLEALQARQAEGPAPYTPIKGFVNILARQNCALTKEMLPLLRAALLLWDGARALPLRRQAEAQLALCLRRKQPYPSFYPLLLQTLPQGPYKHPRR